MQNNLQQAAIDCIRRCRTDLAQSGYYIRSSIELEFCAKDLHGQATSIACDDGNNRFQTEPKLSRILREKLGDYGQYFQNLSNESYGRSGFYARLIAQAKDQYEIRITEPTPLDTDALNPEHIAATTCLLRQMLQETLSFDPRNDGVTLDFSSFPHRIEEGASAAPENQGITSGIHVNISLYNQAGRNCFSDSSSISDFQLLCGRMLLKLQQETWPLMIPDDRAAQRLYANNSAPGGLGCITATTTHEISGDAGKNNRAGKRPISVRIIKPCSHDAGMARIENRLPGADSDPYVAMAITMASLVYAVRLTHGKSIPAWLHTDDRGNILKESTLAIRTSSLPSPASERLESMKEILGDEMIQALHATQSRHCEPPSCWLNTEATVSVNR